ncbi:hypothetical protein SNEBB_004398 [Seison nebaliae]|nr:hypothetical protein SNEBB_004398 [Seison nebaliae]
MNDDYFSEPQIRLDEELEEEDSEYFYSYYDTEYIKKLQMWYKESDKSTKWETARHRFKRIKSETSYRRLLKIDADKVKGDVSKEINKRKKVKAFGKDIRNREDFHMALRDETKNHLDTRCLFEEKECEIKNFQSYLMKDGDGLENKTDKRGYNMVKGDDQQMEIR